MSSFCSFAFVHTLDHNFLNETTVWEKSTEALFNRELKKNISPTLAQLVSRPVYHLKFISLSHEKIFFDFFQKFKFSILT
jgi:hypothetical protein